MTESLNTLFVKYLDDSCSEAEIRALLEHFKIPENEGLLKQFILTEMDRQDELDSPLADLDQRLQSIYDKIQLNIQPKPFLQRSVIRMAWFRVVAAAAAVVLIAGASVFYFTRNQSEDGLRQKITNNHIKPGYNQATLTLANGQKINLSDALSGQIAVQAGVRITKTASGQLVYNAGGVQDQSSPAGYNTIEAPVGGQWQVILPDNSHVWLNAMSSITYPTRFTGKERNVQLKGEAYFEVAHNPSMPFRVQSHGQTVEVLGTHFDIMAYDDEKLMKTTLLQGSVRVTDYGKQQLLKPGQQAQVGENGIKMTRDVDLEDVIAWKNGYFKFNENLEAIMNKIARWYDVKIVYESKPDPAYLFEGDLSRGRDLSEILKIMEYTGKVHFAIEGRRIIVKK